MTTEPVTPGLRLRSPCLDDLKPIHDELGHLVGDRLSRDVAAAISRLANRRGKQRGPRMP